MKYVISRFNHDIDWLAEYTADYILYDRSEQPAEKAIVVPNLGSNIFDYFTFIIDHYDNLPAVAVYCKANLFKYISKQEFDQVKDNKVFTPLLTQNHETKMAHWNPNLPFSFYSEGMYYEMNNQVQWLYTTKCNPYELMAKLGIRDMRYVPFAPGANYILPKTNILKHSKDFYKELREYLAYDVYPPEAYIMERGLYTLWR